jgi:hypothetical protein
MRGLLRVQLRCSSGIAVPSRYEPLNSGCLLMTRQDGQCAQCAESNYRPEISLTDRNSLGAVIAHTRGIRASAQSICLGLI